MLDKVVDKVAALGVPGLLLITLVAASPWAGAAAFTSVMAALGGPLGMVGGVVFLGVVGLVSQAVTDYGFEAVYKAVVRKLKESGMSDSDIRNEINSYPISKHLKFKLLRLLDDPPAPAQQRAST